MREYWDYIQDILEAIKDVESFILGMSYEDFKDDRKTIFAVVKGIENIGEAAKRVPRSIRNRYADVPWKDMAGMRDKLSHEYFNVHIEVVWKTIQQDLPKLKVLISRVMAELNDE